MLSLFKRKETLVESYSESQSIVDALVQSVAAIEFSMDGTILTANEIS